MLVVVAHGEEDEEHEQVLEDADNLDVGIGHFPVENVAAQAAEHPRVGRNGGDEVTASVDEGREFALPSQQEDDGQRQEAVEKSEERQAEQVRPHGQDPEAEQGQGRHDDDDVEADEPIRLVRRQPAPPFGDISGNHGQDDVCENINHPECRIFHGRIPSLYLRAARKASARENVSGSAGLVASMIGCMISRNSSFFFDKT